MHPGIHAQTTPDKAAYVMAAGGERVSYRQLDAASNRCAQLFRAHGLEVGDGIAIMMENHPRYYEVVWGAQRAGLYYTAMSTRLTPGEVEYVVNDCDAKVLVTSSAMAGVAGHVVDRTPQVRARFMIDGTVAGFAPFEAAVAAQPATPIADEIEGADLLYSSGTTGRPKGVKFRLPRDPFGTPNALVLLASALYQMSPDTVYLSPAPLYHAAPLRFNLAVQRLGGTCVLMEHFDAEEFLRLVERHRSSRRCSSAC